MGAVAALPLLQLTVSVLCCAQLGQGEWGHANHLLVLHMCVLAVTPPPPSPLQPPVFYYPTLLDCVCFTLLCSFHCIYVLVIAWHLLY